MDPKLLKLIQNQMIVMAPAEEFAGGGDDFEEEEKSEEEEDEDSEEEDEDESEDDEEDEEEEEDEDDDEDSEEDDEESEEDEDESEKEDGKLGQRAQKRIKKLLGDNKRLKEELEEAKKLGGDDGKTIIAVAQKAGILPRLMTKETAEKIEAYEQKAAALEYIQDQLDDEEATEFEIGGKTYSRKELKQKARGLQREIDELEETSKEAKRKAVKETKELIELGLKAKKAGWTGEKGKEKTKKSHKQEKPGKGKVHKPGKMQKSKKARWGRVDSDDDLEAMIVAQMHK